MNETPREARLLVAKALRSGSYIQAEGGLERKLLHLDGEEPKRGNCCLGVACREYIKAGYKLDVKEDNVPDDYVSFGGCPCYLPIEVQNWLGFEKVNPAISKKYVDKHDKYNHEGDDNYLTLADLNDRGLSFKEIAVIFEDEEGFD